MKVSKYDIGIFDETHVEFEYKVKFKSKIWLLCYVSCRKCIRHETNGSNTDSFCKLENNYSMIVSWL